MRETFEDVEVQISKRSVHLYFKQEQRVAVEAALKNTGLPIRVFRDSAMGYNDPFDAETVRVKLKKAGFTVGEVLKYNR